MTTFIAIIITFIAIIVGTGLAYWLETYTERRKYRAKRGNNSFVIISTMDGHVQIEPARGNK